MTAEQALEWYALYTRARHEKTVDRKLESMGFESFLPLQRVLSQWKDRKKWVEKPLFPGYLFVRAARENVGHIWAVRSVVQVLGDGTGPLAVPEDQVLDVRQMVTSEMPAEPWPYLEAGQRVRVLDGPLIGMEGFVVEQEKRCRLVISVNMLGRSVAAEIDRENLEPL